jgi:hypothetical protein
MKLVTRAIGGLVLALSIVGVVTPIANAAPTSKPTVTQVKVATPTNQAFRLDAAPSPLAGAQASGMGTLAQGGFDRDHYWFKISKGEVVGIGVSVVCRAIFGGIGWFVCPPIAAAVNQIISQYPNAGGFWGELYTNGRVRAGTW